MATFRLHSPRRSESQVGTGTYAALKYNTQQRGGFSTQLQDVLRFVGMFEDIVVCHDQTSIQRAYFSNFSDSTPV